MEAIGFIIFVLGASIGSFLNVCIYRLPKKESIVYPMSHCPKCSRNIFWYDNIPLLSYIALKGRCRFCGTKISFRYFTVELLTAFIFLFLFLGFGITPKLFAYSVFACGLIIATFVDFEIQEIPDEISLGGAVAGLLVALAFPSVFNTDARLHSVLDSAAGLLAGGAAIYAMGVFGKMAFKKEAMGGGDVKLMAMIGAFLGLKLVLFTFFLAPVFGSIAGITLRIKDGREIIPYGPYLSLAALVALFFGDRILNIFFMGLF